MSIIRFIVFISIFCILLSCEKCPEPVSNEGVIRGYVRNDLSENLEGVQVTASGPYGKLTKLTDSEGVYEFKDMGNGNYHLEFKRNDMGTRRLYNIRVFKDETVYAPIMLYHLPGDFKMPSLVKAYLAPRPRAYPSEPYVCIQTNVSSASSKWYNYRFEIILFFSRTPDVSYTKFDFAFSHWEGYYWDDPVCLYCNPSSLPFNKGEKVYVIAYAGNRNENQGLLDPYTGKTEFSTIDLTRYTRIVEFVMP